MGDSIEFSHSFAFVVDRIDFCSANFFSKNVMLITKSNYSAGIIQPCTV